MSDILAETWFKMAQVTTDSPLRAVYLKRAHERAPDLVGPYAIERVLEKVSTLVRCRNYPLLKEHVGFLVDLQGWKDIFLLLRKNSSGMVGMSGMTRDALFHILGIGQVVGLDIDPLKAFNRLKGDSFDDVRKRALKYARKKLVQQVRNQNTFFLNVDSLQEGPFSDIVTTITEVRKDEVLDLSATPTHKDVISTYYGFEAFANHSSYYRERDTVSEGRRLFKRQAKFLGKKITWKGKILPLGNTVWSSVSEELHALLINVLRVSLDRKAERAVRELGNSGDSRVMNYLNQMYQNRSIRSKLRTDIVHAIAEIREPMSKGDDFWLKVAMNINGL